MLAACGQIDRRRSPRAHVRQPRRGRLLGRGRRLERLPLADGRLDLVVSLLALQTVNDLPGALIQIRRALAPDGLSSRSSAATP